jgi:hypothetical protein
VEANIHSLVERVRDAQVHPEAEDGVKRIMAPTARGGAVDQARERQFVFVQV